MIHSSARGALDRSYAMAFYTHDPDTGTPHTGEVRPYRLLLVGFWLWTHANIDASGYGTSNRARVRV